MSLTGNELVTADGLKALHDYNEEAYVKATNSDGYVMQGNIMIKKENPHFYLSNTAESTIAYAHLYYEEDGFFGLTSDYNNKQYGINIIPTNESGDRLQFLNEGGRYSLYGEHNKPTAEDVGAFASDNLIDNAYIGDCDDLTDGVWKISNDATNKPYDAPCIIIHKDWDVNFAVQMCFIYGIWRIMFRFKSGGVWGLWEYKFLPLSGAVSMTGQDLWLNNKKGKIATDATSTIIYVQNDDDTTNRRALVLYDNNTRQDLNGSLIMRDKIDGNDTSYAIFGEHNKDLLATTIQSLIDEGKITIN